MDSGPRRLIHQRQNEIIRKSKADAFMPWADDLFSVSSNWDEVINQVITKANIPAFSWQELQDPKNHTAIVLERKWVEETGKFYPEYFPFWFADTWMKEVFCYAYGQDMPILERLGFSHKREKTINMHDLAFWFRVFSATRGERIEEAKKVCKAYNIAWFAKPQLTHLFETQDALQLQKVPQYERAFASKGEKSQMYLEAKEKAEKVFTLKNAFLEVA